MKYLEISAEFWDKLIDLVIEELERRRYPYCKPSDDLLLVCSPSGFYLFDRTTHSIAEGTFLYKRDLGNGPLDFLEVLTTEHSL